MVLKRQEPRQKATHDYVRNGTLDLFAALEVATGKVITDLRKSHTAADFIAFLNKIDREVTDDLDVHVILDNLSTHKTPAVREWLLRHSRFHFHFTPTYGSWMYRVERTAASKRSPRTSATGSRPGTTTPDPSPGTRAPLSKAVGPGAAGAS